jgi:putative MATE family efflux protein
VSRCWGASDRATGRRALNQAVVIGLALGIATSIGVFLAAPLLATFLAATPEAHDLFIRYVRIDCWGYVLYSIVLVCGGVVRAAGDTRTPMRIMVGVNVANALISSALVFGWFGRSYGASGIAFGTVMARTIGGVLMIWVLIRGLDGLKLNWREMRPDFEILRRITRVGLPAAADAGVMWIAQMAFIKLIASTASGDLGTANYAAHMIAMRFEALTYLPAMAWMTAAATLVGQYLGANDPRRATRAGHVAALQGASLTLVVSISFWTMAGLLYSLFTEDSAVREIGTPALRLLGFIQPILAMAIIYMGALRGAGDTRTTMGISVIGGLAVRLPLAYLGGIVLHGGLIGAWCGMWADNITKFVLGWARFVHGGWKRVRV